MAALREHTLLYDADCPLCQAYSSAFVQTGFLDQDGRLPFDQIKEEWKKKLDLKRARHEIALVHRKTGEVWYGTVGLVKILGVRIPLIAYLFRFRFIQVLVNCLYGFISYNRKVIMPFRKNYSRPACAPDYHAGYRTAYVLLSGFLTAVVLQWAGGHHVFYNQHMPAYAEYWIVPAQWLFQLLVLKPASKEEAVTYLGQLQTASLMAALLIVPFALVAPYAGHVGQFVLAIGFAGAVVWLFFQHRRRLALLHFPKRMTYSWIAFRILLLFVLVSPTLSC